MKLKLFKKKPLLDKDGKVISPPMNLDMYKKICTFVRIEDVKDKKGKVTSYLVQHRKTKKAEWHTIFETINLKKAIQKKHFQILVVIRDIGHRKDLLNKRRKQRGY